MHHPIKIKRSVREQKKSYDTVEINVISLRARYMMYGKQCYKYEKRQKYIDLI
jgi:hypothetical protein